MSQIQVAINYLPISTRKAMAKKGGNNVASLVMKTLDKLGLLDREKGIGNELNLVFDNCPGQNKNGRTFLEKQKPGFVPKIQRKTNVPAPGSSLTSLKLS
jgi:hypothetical protein